VVALLRLGEALLASVRPYRAANAVLQLKEALRLHRERVRSGRHLPRPLPSGFLPTEELLQQMGYYDECRVVQPICEPAAEAADSDSRAAAMARDGDAMAARQLERIVQRVLAEAHLAHGEVAAAAAVLQQALAGTEEYELEGDVRWRRQQSGLLDSLAGCAEDPAVVQQAHRRRVRRHGTRLPNVEIFLNATNLHNRCCSAPRWKMKRARRQRDRVSGRPSPWVGSWAQPLFSWRCAASSVDCRISVQR
jgi:hypothetical protein